MSPGLQQSISARGKAAVAVIGLLLLVYTARFGYLHHKISVLRDEVPLRVSWAAQIEGAATTPMAPDEMASLIEEISRVGETSLAGTTDNEAVALLRSTPSPNAESLRQAARLIRTGTGTISVRLGYLFDQTWLASLLGVCFGSLSLVALILVLSSNAELARWRARWVRLSRAASDGTWDWDLTTGKVEFSGSCPKDGHSWRVGVLDDWYAQIHPDERDAVRRQIDLHLAGERPMFEAEFRVQGSGGVWRFVLARGIADRRVANVATHMACWQTDITDRRQAAEAAERLRASEMEFRRALDAVPEAVLILCGDRILYANTVAYASFGPIEEATLIVPLLRTASREGGAARVPQTGDAVGNWEVLAPTSISFGGELAELLVARDVGQRVTMEGHLRAAERMVALGGLAAGLAHEINNPLTYVIGNLELAQEGVGDIKARIARALGGAVRVRQVVSQLRALANPTASELVPVHLGPAVESAIGLALGVGHLPATIHREFAQVGTISANPVWIGQIALNLVSNALQAMADLPRAQRSLHIRANPLPDGGTTVEFADSGPGIDPTIAERLFEPFTTSRLEQGGSGLGLYICRELATRMGGSLELVSTGPTGTTFRLVLAASKAEQAVVETPPVALPRRSGRVLVVDDERVIVELLTNYLGHHHVEACYDVHSASIALAREHWDAVVLDIILPDRSGIELYDEIAARNPHQASRVLFVTGGSLAPDVARFLMRAPNAALLKPFDFRELVNQVDRLVADISHPDGPGREAERGVPG